VTIGAGPGKISALGAKPQRSRRPEKMKTCEERIHEERGNYKCLSFTACMF
jgi:hypothetical protein